MPLFGSSSSRSLRGNHEESNEERFYKNLNNWELPRVPISQIYKERFSFFKADYTIETIEKTVPLSKKQETVPLLSKRSIEKHSRRYKYLHFGLVQVAIKPLSKESLNTPILLSLRDCRFLKFKDSLLRAIETNLCNGPVYFDYYPDYGVSLKDAHEVLTLNIRTGSLPVALIYRVHFKAMTSLFNAIKALRSSSIDETLLMQVDLTRSTKPNPKIIRANEVNFPETWPSPEEGSLENEENITTGQRVRTLSMW
ncbi:Viral movement protein [Trema orientale]|uniref:Viral movement protein n=1 Tax=Trema orientale TaxID=63057 RepID=A0A2P5F4A1_TREOI|nr:Viral movement protein [Trema orientale]